MGVDIDNGGYYATRGAGLSDIATAAQQVESMASTSDDIARMAGLPNNPLTGETKKFADKALQATKSAALDFVKKGAKALATTGVGATTSLTVGSSIGSLIPIPGIGTAIGAIGALVFEGLKALGKLLIKAFKAKPQPFEKKCPGGYNCPEPPTMAIVDLIPWLANQMAALNQRLAETRAKSYCGKGDIVECGSALNTMFSAAFKIVADTVPQLGLPQVERLMQLYRAAPAGYSWFSTSKKKIVWEARREIPELLNLLEHRRAALTELVGRAQQAATLPSNQVPKLRWDLATEMAKAVVQVQLAPGPETLGWYKTLAGVVTQLQTRENLDNDARKANIEKGKKIAASKTPAELRAAALATLKWQCDEQGGRGPACDELRRQQGGAAPSKPTTTAAQADLFKLAKARNKYVSDYLKNMSQRGDQNARMYMLGVSQEPGLTLANLPDKTYEYLDRKAKAGDQAAKLILFAAVKEFGDKLRRAA